MARSDEFFHGTVYPIKDKVVSADEADRPVSEGSMGDPGDLSEGDHAFAVRNNEHHAWMIATTLHPGLRRPRVYQVDPAPDMVPGPWNKAHPDYYNHHDVHTHGPEFDPNYPPHPDDLKEADAKHVDEWASKTGYPVRKRIDIMPGRQGTFPEVSWQRFQTSGPGGGTGPSHPTDEQVKYGMGGLEHVQKQALKENENLSGGQFHNWRKDSAPHSPLREMAGRPQKRLATLFDN